MRCAALFDMDRTLVRQDTATLYTRYQRDIGEASTLDMLKMGGWLLQYTLGVLDVDRQVAGVLGAWAVLSMAVILPYALAFAAFHPRHGPQLIEFPRWATGRTR